MRQSLRDALRLKTRNAPSEHVDQRTLLRILEVSNNPSEQGVERMACVLKIPIETAWKVVGEFDAFVKKMDAVDRYRIRAIRELLLSADKMAEYLTDIEKDADIALQRMRFVRNQTAHSTTPRVSAIRPCLMPLGRFLILAIRQLIRTFKIISHTKLCINWRQSLMY